VCAGHVVLSMWFFSEWYGGSYATRRSVESLTCNRSLQLPDLHQVIKRSISSISSISSVLV
jgi:hypothetical protein